MVNIDTVYQTVLALANKEQRGYITPQEFNLFANQAQMEIFEQYFYDINQYKRIPGYEIKHADTEQHLEEKISIFKYPFQNVGAAVPSGHFYGWANVGSHDIYKLEQVKAIYNTASGNLAKGEFTAEEVPDSKIGLYYNFENPNKRNLTSPTYKKPIFTRRGNIISLYYGNKGYDNYSLNKIKISYIKKPKTPKWTYVVLQGNAQYNMSANDLQHFELHASEQSKLVIKILQLAGVSIKDMSIVQAAAQKEAMNVQLQKS